MLAGCMTASRDLSFAATSGTAFVVNASPGRDDVARWAVLRRVNPSIGTFGAEYTLEIAWGSGSQLNSGRDRLVALSAREIPPGDYAIVELGIRDAGGGQLGLSWLCTDHAAPVYSFTAGSIAIVRTDLMYPSHLSRGQPSNEEVLGEFQRTRERYTHISGDAAIAEPAYWITWPSNPADASPYFGDRCPAPTRFTVRAEPSLDERALGGGKP